MKARASAASLDDAQIDRLLDVALAAKERAHARYSNFPVGAAILGESGAIYPGCNVENASYGATICAERAALCRAVVDGESSILAVAIVADTKQPCPPCGICRQALAEFGLGIVIISATVTKDRHIATLGELFPKAFDPSWL